MNGKTCRSQKVYGTAMAVLENKYYTFETAGIKCGYIFLCRFDKLLACHWDAGYCLKPTI